MAVWNSADKGSGITLSGGDLSASGAASTYHAVRSTESASSGKYYWEITLNSTISGIIGLADGTADVAGTSAVTQTANATGYYPAAGVIQFNGSNIQSVATAGNSDVIGLAWDADSDTLQFYKNNVALGSAVTSTGLPSAGTLFPFVGGQGFGGGFGNMVANFGATAFVYTPPSGFAGFDDPVLDFSITMEADVTVDGTSEYEFGPLDFSISTDIEVTVDGSSPYIEEFETTMVADVTVDVAPSVEIPVPLLVEHTMEAEVTVDGSSPYDGPELMELDITASLESAIEFFPEDAPNYITGTIGISDAVTAPKASAILAGASGVTSTISASAAVATAALVGGPQSIAATAPKATAVLTALGGAAANISATAPRASGSLSATFPSIATITAQAPFASATSTGYATAIATVSANAPAARGVLTAYVTITGVVTATAPKARASLSGGSGVVATILFDAPMARAYLTTGQTLDTLVREVVVNTVTTAVTEYENYDFDSFGTIGGVVYAAGADGIYEVDVGGTDEAANIDASFETGAMSFGSEYLKRMESVYAAYRTSGDIRVSVRTDEGTQYTYSMKFDKEPTIKQRRVPIGKGLKGKYWQIKMENVNGSSFGFDTLNVLAHETVRRIGK